MNAEFLLVTEYYYTMVFQLLLNDMSTLSSSGLSIVALVRSISNPSFYSSPISKNLVSRYMVIKSILLFITVYNIDTNIL